MWTITAVITAILIGGNTVLTFEIPETGIYYVSEKDCKNRARALWIDFEKILEIEQTAFPNMSVDFRCKPPRAYIPA